MKNNERPIGQGFSQKHRLFYMKHSCVGLPPPPCFDITDVSLRILINMNCLSQYLEMRFNRVVRVAGSITFSLMVVSTQIADVGLYIIIKKDNAGP